MTIGHDPRQHGNPTGCRSRSSAEHARLGLVSENVVNQQPRSPPAAHRVQEEETKAGPPGQGPTVLVAHLPRLEGLEVRAGHRQA